MKKTNLVNYFFNISTRKKVLFILAYILLSFSIVFVFSNVFNFKYHVYNEERIVNNIEKSSDENNNYYKISFDSIYSKKIIINYKSNNVYTMGISYGLIDNNEIIYSIDSVEECSYLIDNNVLNVKLLVNNIAITVPKDVVINDIIIDNTLSFNYLLFFLSIIILIVFICLLRTCKYGLNKLPFLFLSIYLGFGLLMIFSSTCVSGSSWDDQIHFENTSKAIYFSDYEVSEAEKTNENLKSPFYLFNTYEEQNSINEKMNKLDDQKNIEINDNFISYTTPAYVPTSLLYNFLKKIGVDFYQRFQIVRMIGLIICALILAFAIKKANKYKLLLFAISLIPTGLFIASNYNYDGYIFAFCLLAFATFINILDSSKVNPKDVLLYIICITLASLTKVIYTPLLLLLLLIPNDNFKSKKQAKKFKHILILIAIMVFSTFIVTMLTSNMGSSDVRGGNNVDIIGQIKYILHNPVSFSLMFIKEISKNFFEMLLSENSFLSFGYYGKCENFNAYFCLLISLFIAYLSSCNDKNKLKTSNRLLLLITCIIIISMTWGILYLSFNDVGKNHIDGVQCRYFMPILIYMIYPFITDKIKFNISNERACFIITTLYIVCYLISILSTYYLYI